MDLQLRVDLQQLLRHGLAQSGQLLIVTVDGVHMYGGQNAELFPDLPLRLIHRVVEGENISAALDLRMEGDEAPARAVIVHNQVVDAHDLRVGQGGLFDLLHQFRVRGLAQQRRKRVPQGIVPGKNDEGGHQQARPTVHIYLEQPGNAHAQQHHGGGNGVGEGVSSSGLHGGGADLPAHRLVIQAHVELHPDGSQQDHRRQQPHSHRLRVQDLGQGAFAQLKAHGDDQGRQQQPCQVLHPAMAEGVVQVRLLPCDGKAQQGDHRGPGVRQVVEGVRHNGHRAGEQTGKIFPCEQQDVEENAVHGAEGAVSPAHPCIGHIFAVLNE